MKVFDFALRQITMALEAWRLSFRHFEEKWMHETVKAVQDSGYIGMLAPGIGAANFDAIKRQNAQENEFSITCVDKK